MSNSPTASKIVRALVAISPRAYNFVYNDKTSFGHSIKVHGWSKEQNETAAKLLRERGFDVKVRKITYKTLARWRPQNLTVYRLHVYGA